MLVKNEIEKFRRAEKYQTNSQDESEERSWRSDIPLVYEQRHYISITGPRKGQEKIPITIMAIVPDTFFFFLRNVKIVPDTFFKSL
jgi:hypothetical protein